jgi:asparagine synthase (glutamine-hydrolysing)
MCGIVGLWNVECEHPLAAVRAMLESMKHRGPDGRGTMEYAGGAAGMVRLALVDLSDRGQQPLWSTDGRVAILFNGEMYNYRAERARLEAAGHAFRTTTDTEVLLNLYLERGLDFHEHVRGMYALAIFDWRQSASGGVPVMVLARGPLGIKHLYVAHPGGDASRVIFSSEIRALLESGLVQPEVDREALAGYLAHGFVVQPNTMISGVRMLDPGTLERYAPGEPVLRRRFWKMPSYAPRQESFEEAAGHLRGILEESVRLHALADAPIGAFLSGGIDSTGIVALMRPHIADLRTYTIRFPDLPGEDEVREAAEAARTFGCRHTVVEVSGREVADVLPRFASELDQPSADGLNTWLISRAAARDVKGVLSGVGGDEWFAGYPVTRRMARYQTTRGGQAQAFAGRIADLAAGWIPGGRLRERAENLATRRSPLATWMQAHSVFRDTLARGMAGVSSGRHLQDARIEELLTQDDPQWRRESPVGLSCLLDTRIYMLHQLLRDSDATSMAHSLELRVPLVDVELANFARTCADGFKLRFDGGSSNHYYGSGAKRVLIKALADVLPSTISKRVKKGFSLPYEHWMRGPLAPLVDDTCSFETIKRRGLIDPDFIHTARGFSGSSAAASRYPAMWTLMILELWCRGVLDRYRQPAVENCAAGV